MAELAANVPFEYTIAEEIVTGQLAASELFTAVPVYVVDEVKGRFVQICPTAAGIAIEVAPFN